MTLQLSCAEQGGVAHLRLAGELDISTAPQLGEAIDRLLGDGHHRVLVDLTDLDFCDSTGMSAFVRGDNEAAAAGGWLRLTGATGRVGAAAAGERAGRGPRPPSGQHPRPSG